MDQIKLSFIILNYNTKHLLRLALKNLLALNIRQSYEIIVVDNASRDGSAKLIKKLYPDIKLIRNKTNLGHARGNNIGVKAANGEYVFIINTDIIFFNAIDITNMLKYMDENPAVGMLGPKLLNGDNSIQASCFRPYSFWTPLYRRTPLGKIQSAKNDLAKHLMSDFNHDVIKEVDWLLGAALLIRQKALNKCGLFNEKLFLYFADFELCDRLKYNAYKIVYYPFVTIIHYHRRESAEKTIWGGLGSLLNYTTRVHLKDWFIYLKIKQQDYGKNT